MKFFEKNEYEKYTQLDHCLRLYDSILVWGTGAFLSKYRTYIPDNFIGFIDNDISKTGKRILDREIYSPDFLHKNDANNTLIIICTSHFDEIAIQIRKIGDYSFIHIEDLVMISNSEKKAVKKKEEDVFGNESWNKNKFLLLAGIHALLRINGCRRFIDSQVGILNNNGYESVEVAPIRYYEAGNTSATYLAVRTNGQYSGIISIDDFVNNHFCFRGMIIHSLYYEYELSGVFSTRLGSDKPILYYAHDYFCICKNRFLYRDGELCIDADGALYCSSCELSIAQAKLRSFHKALFENGQVRIIVPTEDMKKLIGELYTNIHIDVIPHLVYTINRRVFNTIHNKPRVAFLGGIQKFKGWDWFKMLCRDCSGLYDFFYFGMSELEKDYEISFVEATLEPDKSMVDQLKKNSIDIVCLLSLCSETYSYTLFEALEAGCYIVTTSRSGNICKVVKEQECGHAFSSYEDMFEWFSNTVIVKKEITSRSFAIDDVADNTAFLELL